MIECRLVDTNFTDKQRVAKDLNLTQTMNSNSKSSQVGTFKAARMSSSSTIIEQKSICPKYTKTLTSKKPKVLTDIQKF
jgi:hypothetical protein